MKLKVHFLGTAAAEGFPNVFCKCEYCQKARQLGGRNIRSRSSVIIDDTLKVDFPPDSFFHALRDGIDMSSIEDLLITHTHYDHLNAGDLFNRIEGFAHGIDLPLRIHGNDLAMLKCGQALSGHVGDRFSFHRLQPFKTIMVGSAEVTPLLADHDAMETCLLYYIEKNGVKLLYGNDTGWFPDETWEWLKGKKIDIAILDCTGGLSSNKRARNHMCVETIMEVQHIFQKENILADQGQIIVTHFSHNCKLLYDDLVSIFDPAGIEVAYDGMIINI
jgi:phosphoribosyl 1,2-cyclic phosphate phosphodiesterase